jgi:hypothetical protein
MIKTNMMEKVLSGYRLVSSVDINVIQSAREIKNTQARDIDNIGHQTQHNDKQTPHAEI